MSMHPSRQAYVEEEAEVSTSPLIHNSPMRQAAAPAQAPSSNQLRMARLKLTDGG